MDESTEMSVDIEREMGTGIPVRLTVTAPDSIYDAHDRVQKIFDKYQYDNTPAGNEPGDNPNVSLWNNSDGEVVIFTAQDAAPSDADTLASIVKNAVLDTDQPLAASDGPS